MNFLACIKKKIKILTLISVSKDGRNSERTTLGGCDGKQERYAILLPSSRTRFYTCVHWVRTWHKPSKGINGSPQDTQTSIGHRASHLGKSCWSLPFMIGTGPVRPSLTRNVTFPEDWSSSCSSSEMFNLSKASVSSSSFSLPSAAVNLEPLVLENGRFSASTTSTAWPLWSSRSSGIWKLQTTTKKQSISC